MMTAGRKKARSNTCIGLVGTFQWVALRDGLPANRSGTISLSHSKANSAATAIRKRAVPVIARPANQSLIADMFAVASPPTRVKMDRPRRARRAVDAATDAGASNLPPATLGQMRGLYANTAEQGAAANAPGVKGRNKDASKLAKRMAERIDQVLYFTADFGVDWTNNTCEQAIRMAKLQAKISGSWRSLRGLKAFCRIRSYIATARAHRVPVFTALRDAFLDSPWSIPTAA